MNSLKHGMRSKKMALRREDSYAFENRLRKWTARLDPEDDIGEFLIYRTVFYSFEIEYAERAASNGSTRGSRIPKRNCSRKFSSWASASSSTRPDRPSSTVTSLTAAAR